MTEQRYVAGGPAYLYPAAGDKAPPASAKVLLLTEGGICITGTWGAGDHLLGWAPLPKRDRAKERIIESAKGAKDDHG
jgi:hypothetical protein